MKFKKFSFISLMLVTIMSIFGFFSHSYAINYKFDAIGSTQNVKNKDSIDISLILVEGTSSYVRLHPFTFELCFNKNLFDFNKITHERNIRTKDIIIQKTENGLILNFNPTEPRVLSKFSEIFKINFTCKSNDVDYNSYFSINIIDSETGYNFLSKSIEVNIKNETQNPKKENNPNENTACKPHIPAKAQPECHLKSIIPNVGKLNPSFDMNTLKYNMEVPQEIQEIYFDITPLSENTNVQVSRHRLGCPGTITYINITSKNQSKTLTYLIEVKRNINPVTSKNNKSVKENIETEPKISKSHKAGRIFKKPKYKNCKSKSENTAPDIHKRSRRKSKKKSGCRKNPKSKNSDGEDDDEEYEENEDQLENNDSNGINKNKSETLKNNKIYWIIIFGILILSIIVYLWFRKRSQLSNNNDSSSENDINNF